MSYNTTEEVAIEAVETQIAYTHKRTDDGRYTTTTVYYNHGIEVAKIVVHNQKPAFATLTIDPDEQPSKTKGMKMTYHGMSVTERADGRFEVTSDNGKYQDIVLTYSDAGAWLYEMADNLAVAREINRRMCKKWEKNFFEDWHW